MLVLIYKNNLDHLLNGSLVYPTVTEDIDFSYHYNGSSHDIYVRTVNLNQPWQKIEERIKQIIK